MWHSSSIVLHQKSNVIKRVLPKFSQRCQQVCNSSQIILDEVDRITRFSPYKRPCNMKPPDFSSALVQLMLYFSSQEQHSLPESLEDELPWHVFSIDDNLISILQQLAINFITELFCVFNSLILVELTMSSS